MEGLDLFWQQREDPISVVDPSAVFGELLFNADIARNRCVSDSSAIPPTLVTDALVSAGHTDHYSKSSSWDLFHEPCY